MTPPVILVNAIPLVQVATGICRYVRQVYAALERRHGQEARFLYFDGSTASPAMPEPAAWSARAGLLRRLPTPAALAARLAVHARRELAFARVLRRHRVDVYHETAFFPFHVPAGLPTVFTVHDLSLQRHPQWHPRERVLYARLFFRSRLPDVTHFLSVSAFTARELTAWADIAPARITVTPLAHDRTLFYEPDTAAVAAVRARYALPERFFLFLGSGDPRKNAALIPRAVAAAGLDVPVVGVGWRGWDDPSGGIRSLGFVPDADLAGLYATALALVYPSRYEGFGLPVLEAMACGCPVVTTRAASLPEAGGTAALYMDSPDDAAGLGDLLRRLAEDDDLRHRCRREGLAHAARFSWDRTAAATWEVLTRAASRTAP
ncbi:putative glycosyltransferase, group 1 family protein [Megalodesulfovibrio gigas DSM 1382 = ATCC 19364]|uniref:Putative glycosyltransferase, group 1 family protein n=2 Tax=Megalodesulfovibrio gigas TaxID=879 RepID=T2GAZ8_MEGG1|nr:putative glycosyltransferase, group 1 family protein [Megalodesulfovibrio gigas DSM 1382 = ATCC 19364]